MSKKLDDAVPREPSRNTLPRRTLLGAASVLFAGHRASAGAMPVVRLGVLNFGTVQWVADVIRRHALDRAHGLEMRQLVLANNDAGRIALMSGAADVVVTDWLFAASARARGTPLCFAPFSSATGGIMVNPSAPGGVSVGSLKDLAGRRLGVAGGPLDKSWLIVRAAAKARDGIDLAAKAALAYAAPPLLNAKLLRGNLDAVLTFWNFAARLRAQGCREVVSVADCAATLGLPRQLNLVGFAFHEDWARRNRPAIDGFLAAAAEAQALLAGSEAEWHAVRPLMDAPDEALFQGLRTGFIAGIAHPDPAAEERAAAALLSVLLRVGGAKAADGLSSLPAGLFWRADVRS